MFYYVDISDLTRLKERDKHDIVQGEKSNETSTKLREANNMGWQGRSVAADDKWNFKAVGEKKNSQSPNIENRA